MINNLPQTIFRAYDIRGLYPEQLNAENATKIGRGFASFLVQKQGIKNPRMAVGRDNRTHSLELQKAFVKGLIESGCDVMTLGLTPTPLLYFAVTNGGFDAGCNITASHNPAKYNGFKLVGKNAHAIYGAGLQMIFESIQSHHFVYGAGRELPVDKDLCGAYLSKLKTLFPAAQGRKIVVDTGNGVTGNFYPRLIAALGNEVIPLFQELDGTFPNHAPDPIVEGNLIALKKAVIDHKADLGIAFDGDGDRLGIVDEKGHYWNADRLAMLYVRDVLRRFEGAHFVFTVSNSQLLFDLCKEWGGQAHLCPVGHSYVEEAMQQYKAILGGEQSGHFFLAENYYSYDDALVAACRAIQIQKESEKPLSSLFEAFPETHSAPELRPYCPDQDKFSVMERIKTYFLKRYPKSNALDGIRIDFGEGAWAGIRVSNTSPCLSICLEAPSQKKLKIIQDIVLGHLGQYSEINFDR